MGADPQPPSLENWPGKLQVLGELLTRPGDHPEKRPVVVLA